ncbi:hypothetical protein [Hymenobacter sp. GOD-10R]|uniref:hypothetical protein n=1 Tax=Hymenobacter sp. GOD-10R TaxID=3093922 RepID=UPI002D79BCDB|nr:hypothetical protein [Hymenobacter sp. GOD-10R]WRQ29592.1 hypothetical protein SD425_04870 [Hymenobacter sp. GOD-10R]
MLAPTRYFHNAAASISYHPAGYVQLDWQPTVVSSQELRAIYEHLLRAMKYFEASSLMTTHNQRPPMPQDVQQWLVETWVPQAIAEVNYARCAIVEAEKPLSRLAARTVGGSLMQPLTYAYFTSVDEATVWLTAN